MKKFEFRGNREQRKVLYGLAYWVANENYLRERFRDDEPELQRCRNTILNCLVPECDKLKIPFWVQNTVICFAEDWRRYKANYLDLYLKGKNIYI